MQKSQNDKAPEWVRSCSTNYQRRNLVDGSPRVAIAKQAGPERRTDMVLTRKSRERVKLLNERACELLQTSQTFPLENEVYDSQSGTALPSRKQYRNNRLHSKPRVGSDKEVHHHPKMIELSMFCKENSQDPL